MLKNLITILFYDPDKGWIKDSLEHTLVDEVKAETSEVKAAITAEN